MTSEKAISDSSVAMMRAVEYDAYGPAEVLKIRSVTVPQPERNEALVRVLASTVNPIDAFVRSGALKFRTGRTFPKRTGIDFAGEVVAAGDDLGIAVGSSVWGVMPLTIERGVGQGSAADYVTITADRLAIHPTGMNAVEAAAMSSTGAVALIALREKAKLQRGERLLVRGAAGGVGCMAVQIGALLGAHVTALASGGDLDFVRSLGADEAYDHRSTDPRSLPRFDVVLDLVGRSVSQYRALLTDRGRIFCLALPSLGAIAYIAASKIHGAKRVQFFSAAPMKGTMTDLATWVEERALRPVVHATYALEQIAEAQRSVEAGGGRGKRVLDHALKEPL